ncbi:MAG: hypothetical protein WDZ85_01890 [Candidatus Paceibacterota bacterium]
MKKHLNQVLLSFITGLFGWHEAEKIFEKIQIALTIVMQLAFIGAFILGFFERQWVMMFVSVVAMLTIWLPVLVANRRRVHIPIEFEFLLTAFLYGTLFLGEIRGFYTRFWWWDAILHAGAGLALGFLGFLILYILHYNQRLNLSPGWLAFFSFTFALALGALWEIFEFNLDSNFSLNMQKSLRDTMWDMVMDTGGAFITSVSGYLYLKSNRRGVGVFEHYLMAYLKKNLPPVKAGETGRNFV